MVHLRGKERRDGDACGQCESCRLRLAGFADADAKDPAKYAKN